MSRIKRNNKSGAAIIVVLCITAILTTLCLSILLAASVLINNAQAKSNSEQCRLSAVTLSKVLEDDLTAVFQDNPTAPLEADSGEEDKGTEFYMYISKNLKIDGSGGWPYYNPDELNHGESAAVYKDLQLNGSEEGKWGKISLRLYWEFQSGAEQEKIRLHVDVTAEKFGQQHTVRSIYGPGKEDTFKWSPIERS